MSMPPWLDHRVVDLERRVGKLEERTDQLPALVERVTQMIARTRGLERAFYALAVGLLLAAITYALAVTG